MWSRLFVWRKARRGSRKVVWKKISKRGLSLNGTACRPSRSLSGRVAELELDYKAGDRLGDARRNDGRLWECGETICWGHGQDRRVESWRGWDLSGDWRQSVGLGLARTAPSCGCLGVREVVGGG